PDPLLETALACVDDFYARMFRDWPEAINRPGDHYMLSYSGDRRLTGANHLWPYTANTLTLDRLSDAEDFFYEHSAAWSVVITDTCMPGLADQLVEWGYYARWQSPLMVLDGPPHQSASRPRNGVIRASTLEHLDQIKRVLSEAFATGSSVNRRVIRPTHLGDPTIVHYLVHADNEPAACATVALCSGMASIWNVATRYAFRRRGYARAIMLTLLDDLRDQGYHASTLMASPNGYPLYEGLGYREIGQTMYMGPVLPYRKSEKTE
ncbi:MAG: GNAT family N-acetyltransferase, partial [Chloroflexi bacterium]|nr:GNAT family N-acetyltransferase [Chloroflexota bacterium]